MNLTPLRSEHLSILLPMWNRPEVLSALTASMAQLSEGDLADRLLDARPGTITKTWSITGSKGILGTISLASMHPITRTGEVTNRVVGKGSGWMVGYRAVKDVIEIGFNDYNLNRIECYVHDDNRATHLLCKRLKLNVDGIIRQSAFKDGAYQNITVYSLLRGEWDGH